MNQVKAEKMSRKDWVFVVIHSVVILGAIVGSYASLKSKLSAYSEKFIAQEKQIKALEARQAQTDKRLAEQDKNATEIKIYMQYTQRDILEIRDSIKEIKRIMKK